MSDIAIGERVRSYDFEHNRTCYHEGTVLDIINKTDCLRYKILTEIVVWDGQPEPAPKDHYVYPPVNGTPIRGGGFCRFVERVEGGQNGSDQT